MESTDLYLTNISQSTLNASDIAAVYAARWEVELIFKELKSRYELDHIRTSELRARMRLKHLFGSQF